MCFAVLCLACVGALNPYLLRDRRSFARLCVLSQSVVAGHVAGRRVWVIGPHGLPVLVGRRLLAMIVSIAVAGTRCHGSARTKARGTTANHRPPTAVPSTT